MIRSLPWNVIYEYVPHIKLPRQATLISYADKIITGIVDKGFWILSAHRDIGQVDQVGYLVSHGLESAEHKTKGPLVSSHKLTEVLRF